MRKLALALALPALAAGCAGLKDLARSTLQEPKLSFRSANVQALDLDGATVALLFDLSNPNAFGLDLARAGWAVDMDGTRIASGDMPGGLAIPANGTAPITLPVHVRFRDVPGIAALLSSGKDAVPYTVSGALGVRTPLGILDVPLSHSDTLRLPRLPHIALDGISLRGFSLESLGVGFVVRLRVSNPNRFPIPAGGFETAVALGGSNVASAQVGRLQPLPAGASALVEIPVSVDPGSALRAATLLGRGGDVDVHLTGKVDVAGLQFPLDLRARAPARR
jgi:LEA14-like dessication related protein